MRSDTPPGKPMSHVRRLRARLDAHGQSLVEFSIVLPVLLLESCSVGIDFGRVYLGWVNSQNMARLAANFAANNAVKLDAGDADTEDEYQVLVTTNARATNCRLWYAPHRPSW